VGDPSAVEALTGFARDRVIGMTDYDIFPREQADVFRANDRAVLERGVPLAFEESSRTRAKPVSTST
jgi:hypothetical protein